MIGEHETFSQAGYHLIAIIAILGWIFYLALTCERKVRRRRNRRVWSGLSRAPDPHHTVMIVSPRWNSQETEPTTRHTP